MFLARCKYSKALSAWVTGKLIEGINVRMICLGASKHNFCFLVEESKGAEVVKKLHEGLDFEG